MGFAVSIIITAVGFILALAVHLTHPGSVNVNTVGWILVVVGLVAGFADLVLWSSWGPGLPAPHVRRRGPRLRRVSGAPRLPAPARDRGRRRPAARPRVLDSADLPTDS